MTPPSPYHLLTGATGLIGSQLLARLLRRHVPVCVLVRPHSQRSERSRIESILQRFETSWGQRLPRPTILSGDLALPGLGLSPADISLIGNQCSTVIHLAASLSFRPASKSKNNEPYRTNVDGTNELLKICAQTGVRHFHYVSTAYVCGTRTETFYEDDLELGQSFSNDYEHSKVLAEQSLRANKLLDTLTVYRPSIVIDTTGDSPASNDRTLYVALSMYRTMAKKFGFMSDGNWFEFLGLSGSERKNLVEAVWVAVMIDGIVGNESLHGRTYHLTSQTGTAISEIEDAFKQVVHSSMDLKPVIQESAVQTPARASHVGTRLLAFSKNALSRGTRTIAETIAGPYLDTFAPYFRNDPVFDRQNLTIALQTLGREDSGSIDADTIARFARIQAAELATTTTGTNVPKLVSNEVASDWLASMAEQDTEPRNTSATSWGLMLIGPGGGDWCIELEPLRVSSAGQACARRVYTDCETWEQLVNQAISLETVVTQRRLVLEWDDLNSAIDELEITAHFSRLIASMRQQFTASGVETNP